jgi:hypothetical protein
MRAHASSNVGYGIVNIPLLCVAIRYRKETGTVEDFRMKAMLCAKLAVISIIIALVGTTARAQPARFPSVSTPVAGVLVDSDTHPLARHELHFEGQISGDIFTVRTRTDGTFSTALPQGTYDLRGQNGAIIAGGVMVGTGAVNLGNVRAPAMYSPSRALNHEEVGEEIVKSPAPSGAYVPNAGAAPQSVAVTPMVNPRVQGASKGSAPVVVVPQQIEEQTLIPPGGEVTVGGGPTMGTEPGALAEPTPGESPETGRSVKP